MKYKVVTQMYLLIGLFSAAFICAGGDVDQREQENQVALRYDNPDEGQRTLQLINKVWPHGVRHPMEGNILSFFGGLVGVIRNADDENRNARVADYLNRESGKGVVLSSLFFHESINGSNVIHIEDMLVLGVAHDTCWRIIEGIRNLVVNNDVTGINWNLKSLIVTTEAPSQTHVASLIKYLNIGYKLPISVAKNIKVELELTN